MIYVPRVSVCVCVCVCVRACDVCGAAGRRWRRTQAATITPGAEGDGARKRERERGKEGGREAPAAPITPGAEIGFD
jgi:hypothetical protein